MSENANKPDGAKKPLDAELFEGEARPAEEASQYGDETDTPVRRKKVPAKKKTAKTEDKKDGDSQPPLFSMRRFRKRLSFFEWLSGGGRRNVRTIRIFGRQITFWPFFLAILTLILIGAIILNNGSIQIDARTVTVVGLPADLEGYRILVISDLNGRRFGENQTAFLRRLENVSYDCVFLLGDMVGKGGNAEPLYELLEGLGTRKPVYFICGDSDPGPYVPRARDITGTLEKMLYEDWILGAMERGATYVDSPICVKVGSAKMWISAATLLNVNVPMTLDRLEDQVEQETDGVLAGLETDYASIPYTTYRMQQSKRLSDAVTEMNATDVHLSLAHQIPSDDLITASCLHDASTKTYMPEADLILAGHYCGGVMRLPIIGAFYIDSPSSPRYGWFPASEDVSGLGLVAESQTYITRGLSTNSNVPLMPFRLLNQPEIGLITLTGTLPESLK